MPNIDNPKTAEKLANTIRSYNHLKARIENNLLSYNNIKVPKSLDGCKEHIQVETLSSILSNKTYIEEQLQTEDGKDNILVLLHSLDVSMTKLRKLIKNKEIVDETEMEG